MKTKMVWIMMLIMVFGLFFNAPLFAEKFKGEDIEVVSVLPPQYMGYRLYAGVAGGTTVFYKVAAVVTGMGETRAGAVLTVYDSNAVLSSTNTLQLIWSRVTDATSYNIYKSTSSSSTYFYLLGNVAQGTYVLNDTGQAVGSAWSAPTVVGGNIIVENDLTAGGALTIGGGFFPEAKTQAEIEAITSTSFGEQYPCSDCTVTLVCGSSVAASATSWCSLADIAVACD